MLFNPIRLGVKNVTEIGIAHANSIESWYDFFTNADIHGFDLEVPDYAMEKLKKLSDRVYPHILDDKWHERLDELGFRDETMDIIIEDGPHHVQSQEMFLQATFRLLKPGGYYIIEDVGYMQDGIEYFHKHPEKLQPATTAILENNDCIFVETAVGHRNFTEWTRRSGADWARDHEKHNSYAMVIKKRMNPVRPFKMHFGAWQL